jgi:hypothetical protein
MSTVNLAAVHFERTVTENETEVDQARAADAAAKQERKSA